MEYLEHIRAGASANINACDLCITRMRQAYVAALPDTGEVLFPEAGISPFGMSDGVRVGEAINRANRVDIQRVLDRVLEANPANTVAARLVPMSWHKAARLQKARSESVLEQLEAL